jgi:hypothetical protein
LGIDSLGLQVLKETLIKSDLRITRADQLSF